MSDSIITVENLGKRYALGTARSTQSYTALRDVLAHVATGPFRVARERWQRRRPGVTSDSNSADGALDRVPTNESPAAFWALRDVSFSVRRGEVVGIIGRNGAGKSTLLKILSRITEPTEGRIRIRGRVASLLEVGTGFHPELTGRENIFLNGAILGMHRSEIKAKFDEIVAFAEVEKFLDTPIKRYSSGMYVRLAFAVAAHLEPEILIVDEVLAVGDADFQKKCLGKMQSVSRNEGQTVLFVSHNMDAIRRLCQKGVLLGKGKVMTTGSMEDVADKYMSSGQEAITSDWISTDRKMPAELAFTHLSAHLSGKQPHQTLTLDVRMESLSQHGSAFVDFDVVAETGIAVMQIQPTPLGFISCENRFHRFTIDVELPPMIPGRYVLSAWAGSHNTRNLDYVESTVAFEINESPVEGRTFAHTTDHGYIVPRSVLR